MDTVKSDQTIMETTLSLVRFSHAHWLTFARYHTHIILPQSKTSLTSVKTNISQTDNKLATVTSSFLKFSASRGNDLTQIGLKDGCKWCLCVTRWKEAADHAKSLPEGSKEREGLVPKVHLESTNESALKSVALEDLKKFAAWLGTEGEREDGVCIVLIVGATLKLWVWQCLRGKHDL